MSLLEAGRRAGPFVLILGIGVWLWSLANAMSIGGNLGRAGPELWPKIVLLLLIGAAIWGVLEALFKKREDDDTSALITQASRSAGHEEGARKDLAGEADVVRQPVFAISGMAAMLAYVAVIPYLGYAVSTFLLLASIMLLAGYRRPLVALVVTLLGALTFFVVFQRIVYVSLPLGVGPFKELSLLLMSLIGVK